MPYMPIDPNEENTSHAGGSNAQPVTGTGAGAIGGAKGGGQGATTTAAPAAGPTASQQAATPSYTNLSSYLQAGAGNNANTNAVNNVFNGSLANANQAAKAYQTAGVAAANKSGTTSGAEGQRQTAVNAINKTSGFADASAPAQLQQTFGNSYGGPVNQALDSALTHHTANIGVNPVAAADKAVSKAAGAYKPPAPPAPASTPGSVGAAMQHATVTTHPQALGMTAASEGVTNDPWHIWGAAHGGEVPAFDSLTKHLKGRK